MFEDNILISKKSKPELEKINLLKNYAKSRERKKRSLEHNDADECFEDSVELKKIKSFAPEDTYEIWVQEKDINKNFRRFQGGNKSSGMKAKDKEFEESQDEEKDDEEVDESDSGEIEDFQEDTRASRVQAQYVIQKKGLELLPHIDSDHASAKTENNPLFSTISYTKKHTMFVSKILHLNILRRNWKIAYRCFSLLIRLHHVDIRAIWPLGVEILTRLAEEEFLKTQPEGSIDEYQLRTHSFNNEISERLQLFKDEQFITWLQTFYPINWTLNPMKNSVPLPYRVGSRDTPPVYMLNFIWILIMKQDFKKVNEHLSELLLKSPYIDDGLYYFLQGFSYQLEATQLSKGKQIDNLQVEKLMSDARKFYQEAKDRDADFPEELINNELTLIEKRIAKDVELEKSSNDSGDGDDDENGESDAEMTPRKDLFSHESPKFGTPKRVRNPDSEDEDLYGNSTFMNDNYRDFNEDELGADDSDD